MAITLLNKRPPESLDGIYEIIEAAKYIYISTKWEEPYKPLPRKLFRWVQEGFASEGLATIPPKELLIGFEDLVSLRAITFLRSLSISWEKIREADQFIRKLTNHPRPFATQRLWTEAIDIFTEVEGFLLTASRGGQFPFLELIQQKLVNVHGLTFNASGVANSWTPRDEISLTPNIHSGDPCIAKTGIPTKSIWRMYKGGDSIGFVSKLYGISEEKVQQALMWEYELHQIDLIRSPKAAA